MVSKSIVRLVSILSVIIVLLASFSLVVSADTGKVFTMPLNQPIIDSNHGYLEYVVESPSYKFTPVTLSWFIYDDSHSADLSNFRMLYEFNGVNELLLRPTYIISSPTQPDFSLYYYVTYGDGTTNYYHYSFNSTNDPFVRIKLASGYKFFGFKPYGWNFDIDYSPSYYPTQEFSFVYAQDAPEYQLLLDQYQLLNSIYNMLYTIDGNLSDLSYLETLSSLNTIIKSISTNVFQINSNVSSISSTLTTISSVLNTVNSRLSTVLSRLLNIQNNTDQLENYLDEVESYINDIEPYMLSMISYLSDIDSNTDDIESLLDEIIEILNQSFEEDPSPVPSGDSETQMGQMDDFVGGSNSQNVQSDINSSLSGSSLNGGLSTNASGLLWDMLQRFLDGSPKVFAMLISLLSYGLISLLLGR